MTPAHADPTKTDGIATGLRFEDQRTGELRAVVYADEKVVLTRDERGHTTLTPRETFASLLGTRYRARPDADPDVDFGRPSAAAPPEATDRETDAGEARDAGRTLDEYTDAGNGADAAETDDEVAFEDIDGIGPATAGQLRTTGFVTAADVRRASDEDLLAVSGVGRAALESIREFVE